MKISISLPKELYTDVKELAEQENRTVSNTIQNALKKFVTENLEESEVPVNAGSRKN